jgi:MFS family permease
MKKQVPRLLFVATIDRIIIQGIYPILPVMIANLGTSKKDTGLFMTVTYIAVAAGSMLTPALLKRFPSVNRMTVIISLLSAVALIGMGVLSSFSGLLAATSAYWFLSGIQINVYSIIMSQISPPKNIGPNFGLLANTILVGSVVGSFSIGPLIQHWGMIYAFAFFGTITILSRLALVGAGFDYAYAATRQVSGFRINKKLWILLITLNVGIMLSFIGRFNLSLIMKDARSNIDDISYIFAWGSLLALPLPYLFGLLAKRYSNKALLFVTLCSIAASMYLLSVSHTFTSFLAVSFLICIMTYCSRGVSQKIIYDMYPLNQQTQAQSALTSANWIAAIAGFLILGITSGTLSLETLSLIGSVVGGVAAIVLLIAL